MWYWILLAVIVLVLLYHYVYSVWPWAGLMSSGMEGFGYHNVDRFGAGVYRNKSGFKPALKQVRTSGRQ